MTQMNADSACTIAAGGNETQAEERILLRRLAQGDATAFWEVWERYRDDLLYRHCLRWMGGNLADAEDALSSASLKAWQRLPDYAEEITNVKSWLIRLLHNLCIDMQKAPDSRVNSKQFMEEIARAGGEVAAPMQESAEDTVLRREMHIHIHRAIANLPPRLREPSVLRLLHGMPYRDIAALLNLGSEDMRKRLQQARAILQKQLAVYRPGRDGGVRVQPRTRASALPT